MDQSARRHYIIILISLAICVFLYIDSYLLPTKLSSEKIQDLAAYRSGRNGRVYTMRIQGKDYDIPLNLFEILNIDEQVNLEKSAFTGSLQRIGIVKETEIWIYNAGYLRARFGMLAVPGIILGCIAMLVFFKIIDNIKGRANLTYALFICSLLMLFAHLDLNFF
jgi:hypothetical protein